MLHFVIRDELDWVVEDYRKGQQERYAKRQQEKFGRLEKYTMDQENKERYRKKADIWKNQVDKRNQSDILETANTKG